jgi:hypothetical protein
VPDEGRGAYGKPTERLGDVLGIGAEARPARRIGASEPRQVDGQAAMGANARELVPAGAGVEQSVE